MRRRPGVAGVQRAKNRQAAMKTTGAKLEEENLTVLTQQMTVFRDQLEVFAKKHKNDIKKNPEFRAKFQQMCTQCGVDPLASNKGFWSELLGVGDFYFELAVQIVQVCLASQKSNGGLMDIDDMLATVKKIRNKQAQVPSLDDCERAIQKLKKLGKGFDVITLKQKKLVQSVPIELNQDHSTCLSLASKSIFVTVSQLEKELIWTNERASAVLDYMLKEGFCWVDHADNSYWFTAFLKDPIF